ncbi:L-threonine ammonia-lyase-like isoform X2 [Linepithema humile]|uniref:L-threonine ammonia-lyase-like isoform X2 n=1 Tax=Linepithema humile TaxID=83485 RepID=UPI00062343DA|nr:PREDICTED: threonine dehydratase biosynthetic, chloroplastic-like isoform X2 [Linepithema humile]
MRDAQKRNGVISASTADFALSLCHFGDKLKIPVTVVLPTTTQLKIHTYQWTTATMIFKGDDLNQARLFALMLAKEKTMHYIKRCHTNMIIGYGTLAMEIMEEVPFLEAVLVPYDKTELIRSFNMIMKNTNIQILTIQPQDIKSDEDVQSEGQIKVEKSLIANAMLLLFEKEKCVVDIGGATCLAAMLDDSVQHKLKRKRVVVVLPSCHIDMTNLVQYVEQALISKHCLMEFTLMISKQQPSIAELHNMLVQLKVTIKNIQIQQKQTSMSKISVKVVCEIKNKQHAEIITDFIKLKYKHINIMS